MIVIGLLATVFTSFALGCMATSAYFESSIKNKKPMVVSGKLYYATEYWWGENEGEKNDGD